MKTILNFLKSNWRDGLLIALCLAAVVGLFLAFSSTYVVERPVFHAVVTFALKLGGGIVAAAVAMGASWLGAAFTLPESKIVNTSRFDYWWNELLDEAGRMKVSLATVAILFLGICLCMSAL